MVNPKLLRVGSKVDATCSPEEFLDRFSRERRVKMDAMHCRRDLDFKFCFFELILTLR